MEQLIAQQRKQIENKESEMQRLQRLNASLSEQVSENIIYNNNMTSGRNYVVDARKVVVFLTYALSFLTNSSTHLRASSPSANPTSIP